MMGPIPAIRTSERAAIALCVAAILAMGAAVLAGSQLDKAFNSRAAATAVLAVWCLTGGGAAIAAVVDAYVKPEGEALGYWTTVAAVVFGLLSLVALVGIAIGASGVTETQLG
jgi:peptidoglycan/LPS O-acetylase OafA/YrhL